MKGNLWIVILLIFKLFPERLSNITKSFFLITHHFVVYQNAMKHYPIFFSILVTLTILTGCKMPGEPPIETIYGDGWKAYSVKPSRQMLSGTTSTSTSITTGGTTINISTVEDINQVYITGAGNGSYANSIEAPISKPGTKVKTVNFKNTYK